jgi:hypothetical protein
MVGDAGLVSGGGCWVVLGTLSVGVR